MAMDWLGGTRMKEWLPMAMKLAYKDNNPHLEAYGRKAWKRWLGKYGWSQNTLLKQNGAPNG